MSNPADESVSTRRIALAAARDAIPVASTVSGWMFDASEACTSFGFRAGDTLASVWQASSAAGVVGTAALGAAGIVSAPVALGIGALAASGAAAATATRLGLATVSSATASGLHLGRTVTNAALESSGALLESYGVEEGEALQLAVGRDAAAALRFVQPLFAEIGVTPPPGMTWQQTVEAARALAWLQNEAGGADCAASACDAMPAMENDWWQLFRCLRLSLGCYGHVVLRVLRILPAWSSTGGAWTDLSAMEAVSGGGLDVTRDVLVAQWSSELYQPGHLVLVDRRSEAIVVTIRGSVRLQDVLTDLVCDHATVEGSPLGSGTAHAGMLKAAQRLLAALRPTLVSALLQHPSFSLLFCGHSLGGGLAALLATLLGPSLEVANPDGSQARRVPVRAYAYGAPAVLSLDLARAASALVTSVVEGADMVPRFGLATARDLRDMLGLLHREGGLIERVAAHRRERECAAVSRPGTGEVQAWARSILGWLRVEMTTVRTDRLYPPGRVLWRIASASEAEGAAMVWRLADPTEFESLLLVGSQMLTDHVPSAYARMLGRLPLKEAVGSAEVQR